MLIRTIVLVVIFLTLTEDLQRYEIVNGVAEAETEKGVPNFWLIAMKTNEMLANEVQFFIFEYVCSLA